MGPFPPVSSFSDGLDPTHKEGRGKGDMTAELLLLLLRPKVRNPQERRGGLDGVKGEEGGVCTALHFGRKSALALVAPLECIALVRREGLSLQFGHGFAQSPILGVFFLLPFRLCC